MAKIRLGDFEEILLLLVGILGEDAYALKMTEEYKEQTGRSASIGAVHSTLNRLEQKGFLDSEMGESSAKRGGRRKRIYALTAYGEKALVASRDLKLALWNQYPALALDKLK